MKYKEFFVSGKKHYNEFQAVKMARQLMDEDEDEEEEDTHEDITGEKSKSANDGTNSPMDTCNDSQ